MAKMVSLKLSAKESKEEGPQVVSAAKYKGPKYPYGTKLRLENEVLEKLGIDLASYPEDTTCEITAKGYVCGYNLSKYEGGKARKELEIQITDLQIVPDKMAKKKKAENDHLAAIAGPTSDDYDDD